MNKGIKHMNILREIGSLFRDVPPVVWVAVVGQVILISALYFTFSLGPMALMGCIIGALLVTALTYVIESARIHIRRDYEETMRIHREYRKKLEQQMEEEPPYPDEYIDPENRYDW